ncbi:serpentine type 7TM GPCR chemoreceptor srh domain-containing protein [Ditylenchus destructor]|uniref:Serpentine type 7TM GPCR chemoreceptor srh domain-containing protein n=1 Tax=Ditylenchus destructor TaxID=166010 RepID=A0AAD4N1G0_9BILA|nr:serpentine type 7TM GPCR chemoreceptor srh domain-containing protein [Ditylenchus destructor]
MEYALYSAIVLFITSFSVVLQFYVIFVVIKLSPKSMETYRYFLCLIAVWDLMFSSLLGFGLHPKVLHPLPAGQVNGLFKYLGHTGGIINMSAINFAVVNVIAAQVYSLSYRLAVVLDNTRIQDYFMKPVGIVTAQTIVLGISFGYAIMGYRCIIPTKEATIQYIEGLCAFLNWTPPSRTEVVLGIDFSPQNIGNSPYIPYAIAVIAGMIFVEILCSILAIVIIKILRRNVRAYSKKTYKIQIQLTFLLIIQLLSPIVFLMVPILYPGINGLAVHGTSEATGDLTVIFLSLYALNNPVLTIMFVTPYRRYTLSKLGMCCNKLLRKSLTEDQSTRLSRPSLHIIARRTTISTVVPSQ